MPAIIPYDPALALGDLVSDKKWKRLERMSAIQAPVDAAAHTLDSLRAVKRSLEMTREELAGMGVNMAELSAEVHATEASIEQAAREYAKCKAQAMQALQQLEADPVADPQVVESPVDYARSDVRKQPLSADSVRMEVQYFPRGENEGNASATMQDFFAGQLSVLGDKLAQQALAVAQSQVASQYARQDIAGTLVLSITCMHKDAVGLAPFLLDADKSVQAWNEMFPDNSIKTGSLEDLMALAQKKAGFRDHDFLRVVSGAAYGSFFIGMLHVRAQAGSEKEMHEIASRLYNEFQAGGLFTTRAFGHVLDRMPSEHIVSHRTLTIAPNAAIAQDEAQATIRQLARQAQAGPVLVDGGAEEGKDIAALRKALGEYLKHAIDGDVGIPLHYYVKVVTWADLSEKWIAKQYPRRYFSPGDVDSSAPGS